MKLDDDLQKQRIEAIERLLGEERQARAEAEASAEKSLRALRDRQELSALFERVVHSANAARSVLEGLRLALIEICEHSGARFGNLYHVLRKGTTTLVPSSIWYVSTQSAPVGTALSALSPAMACFPPSGIAARTLATKAPVWITDLTPLGRRWRSDGGAALDFDFDSGFGCPLMAGTEVVAVIECYCDASCEITEDFLREIGRIGMQLGYLAERENVVIGLNQRASRDDLTGFSSRTQFQRLLQAALPRSFNLPYGRCGLLSLDIDRFRAIDQSLGHVAGDEVILEVSLRLRSAIDAWLESHDVEVSIARSGRDEFLVLVEGTPGADETAAFAEALYAALLPPLTVKGQTIRLAVSGGLVESGRQVSAADMMRNAELTTRRAKALGGAHWLWFNDDMHLRALERLKMESDLGSAIENDEFRLLYQPIFELETRRVLGFEALLRWQRAPDNLEPPVNFIGVAEETGHIVLMGAWLIREACRSLAALQRAFPREPPLFVSINVSPRQFRHEALANQFRDAIAENLIAAGSVHLEVTESITIDDVEKTAFTLQTLRTVGVRCGIDDFGTGYSSLNYLHELPFDTLKIDRSFVARLGEVGKSREIVRTLVGLARHLRMQVVVEGIETEFQLTTLTEMGCEMGQGFLLSRPIKFAAVVEMLSAFSSQVHSPSGSETMTKQ